MLSWTQKIVPVVSAVVLAIIGELAAKYVTGSFHVLRLAIVLSIALGLAYLLLITLGKSPRKRVIVDFVAFTTGVIAITIGIAISAQKHLTDSQQLWIVRDCLIALGLLESTLAAYSLYIGLTGRDVDFLPAIDFADRNPQIYTDHGERVAVTVLKALRPEHKAIMELIRSRVTIEDLHFVAYYVSGRCQFFVDVLDHSDLNRFFQDADRPDRRRHYERHGRQLVWLVSALDRSFRRIQGGILIRTVLDVQHGALYHFPIAVGVDLVGVTLIQDRVADADAKLAAIRDQLADLPRGGKLSAAPLRERAYYLPDPDQRTNVLPFSRNRERVDRPPAVAR